MLQNKWTIRQIDNLHTFIRSLGRQRRDYIMVVDTETTGLHIRKDKPFVITLAVITDEGPMAYVYDRTAHGAYDNDTVIQQIYDWTREGLLIGHNLVFDLHMQANVHKPIDHTNLMDTQVMIRLGTDAVQTDKGGAPLKLKEFAARYLDINAKYYERVIRSERSKVAKALNMPLYETLSRPQKAEMRALLERFPEDADDLPEVYRSVYKDWYSKLPLSVRSKMTGNFVELDDVPYDMIDRKLLMNYAAYDVIYTYEIYLMMAPIIKLREQTKTLEMENNLIMPLFRMTRVGFRMNKPYVLEVKARLKAYIQQRQRELKQIAGLPITANQNAVIKELIQTKFGHPELEKTDEPTLSILLGTTQDHALKDFIGTILELRTLAKWYTTYLMRFYNTMQYDDFIYTGINSAGTVTGRVSSDFQQFPKGAIYDNKGDVLFIPRAMILTNTDDTYLLYFDYSQIELRIQAMYTILLGQPDKNLCRAYMPYECVHYRTGVQFDPQNTEHIKNWARVQPNSQTSVWLRKENNLPWAQTDLHAETTAGAYPDIDRHSKEFKRLRSEVGKRANFACNYGAKTKRIQEMFHCPWEEAQRIYKAYTTAFPGVIAYQRYCTECIRQYGWGDNLFGRRYYNTNGHNYANAAVQGTGADFLKHKIIELDTFLREGRYRTKMQMNIHDEISFVMPPDELYIVPKIKEIMELLEGTVIPIVANQEITSTTWADQKGFTLDEQIRIRYNS